MKTPSRKEGHLLADMHNHISLNNSLDEITDSIMGKVIGLASNNGKKIFTYNHALALLDAQEVSKGYMARIRKRDDFGYVVKAQEVMALHHVIGIGLNTRLPDHWDPRLVIDAIHRQAGMAILPHPYSIPQKNGFRFAKGIDESLIEELYTMSDAIEVFNAYNINPFVAPLGIHMHRSNDSARILAERAKKPVIAGSDSHGPANQVGISGFYVPSDNLDFDALKYHIKNGQNELYEQYVSHFGFAKAILPGLIQSKLRRLDDN